MEVQNSVSKCMAPVLFCLRFYGLHFGVNSAIRRAVCLIYHGIMCALIVVVAMIRIVEFQKSASKIKGGGRKHQPGVTMDMFGFSMKFCIGLHLLQYSVSYVSIVTKRSDIKNFLVSLQDALSDYGRNVSTLTFGYAKLVAWLLSIWGIAQLAIYTRAMYDIYVDWFVKGMFGFFEGQLLMGIIKNKNVVAILEFIFRAFVKLYLSVMNAFLVYFYCMSCLLLNQVFKAITQQADNLTRSNRDDRAMNLLMRHFTSACDMLARLNEVFGRNLFVWIFANMTLFVIFASVFDVGNEWGKKGHALYECGLTMFHVGLLCAMSAAVNNQKFRALRSLCPRHNPNECHYIQRQTFYDYLLLCEANKLKPNLLSAWRFYVFKYSTIISIAGGVLFWTIFLKSSLIPKKF